MNLKAQDVTLKPCEKHDIKKIYELSVKQIDRYESYEEKKRQKVLHFLKENIENKLEDYRKIYKNNAHVGYFLMKDEESKLQVEDLLLFDDTQSKNVGTYIAEYWKKLAENYGKPLFLNVFKYNIQALNIYFSQGFDVVEIVKETRVKLGYNKK